MDTNFIVVIPCYNVEKWIPTTLRSVLEQNYQNFRVVIINDASTDKTLEIINKTLFGLNTKFVILNNENKKNALENIINGIKIINPKDEDVIVTLDGDDWFYNKEVLGHLNKVYREKKCLLTYGSYCEIPGFIRGVEASEYSEHVIKNNLFREDRWRGSALRTFKHKLWKNIKDEDLRDPSNRYYEMTWDQAFMLPMLEMAQERIEYVPEILYCYNRQNPLNDDKKNSDLQQEMQRIIRKKNKYDRLEKF